ncbi:MAG: hypothetical protein A2X49_07805 [Lentisphaerae bacterium GWF2_52_8]|nr:MAG: hypothetical protein A2X49_07805 [Lentisphaerae bacterium GWF2_52_8]
MGLVTCLDLFKLSLRSFFVQAVWNFEKMQNPGFLYVIMPGLKKIYGADTGALAARLEKYSEYYNSHPYFAGPIAATLLRKEMAALSGAKNDADNIKSSLMKAYAALGDSFFWASCLPVISIICFSLILSGNKYFVPLLYIVLYNICHLSVRFAGVYYSFARESGYYNILEKLNLKKMNPFFQKFGIYLIGGLIIFALDTGNFGPIDFSGSCFFHLVFLCFTLLLSYFLRNGVSMINIVLGIYTASIIAGLFI